MVRLRKEPQVPEELRDGYGITLAHPFGRTTTERRVSKRMHKVRWALEYADKGLTPAQKQALVMVYGAVIPPARCAELLGITRQAFRERLVRAEHIVDRMYADGKPRHFKTGRPDARLVDPNDAERIERYARTRLGPSAEYVRGASVLRARIMLDVGVWEMLKLAESRCHAQEFRPAGLRMVEEPCQRFN